MENFDFNELKISGDQIKEYKFKRGMPIFNNEVKIVE